MLPANQYPLIIRSMLGFKADLLAGEAAQIEEMAARWLQVEETLQDSFDALALELWTLRDVEGVITRTKLLKMQRYRRLLAQVNDQLSAYTDYGVGRVGNGQLEMIRLGIAHAVENIKSYFRTVGKVAGAFDILPIAAVEAMVGFASDGSPLRKLFMDSWPSAVDGLTQALINATALGKNPNETARLMRQGFGVGFQRSINIARTEQLRAYRASNLEQYKTSKLVKGYKRLSARDSRVCPACLMADDGTIYDLDTPFEEHPQGRCSPVPVVIGMPEVQWQNGQAWFLTQEPNAQRSILGDKAYEAWLDQKFELGDIVKRVENETWGASLVPKPLSELLK